MNKLSTIYMQPITHYENIDLSKRSSNILSNRKCWFCDSKCYSFVAICNSCKSERLKNSSKK